MSPDRDRAPHFDTWRRYAKRFKEKANSAGRSNEFIDTCLNYAKKLILHGVPVIYDWRHFSLLVGFQTQYLYQASNFQSSHYRRFTVKKASGGEREISEPLPNLKIVQRWILDNILSKVKVSEAAKGFVTGLSIKDNAKFHRQQSVVVRIDVKDFFPTISARRVRGVFRGLGYSAQVSELLTKLCTLDGCLPQGAPSSPALSNVICRQLDARFLGYAKSSKIRYTRYADDLVFSGSCKSNKLIRFAHKVLIESGFHINIAKTNVMHAGTQQRVTGLIVNQKIQVPRSLRRDLRKNIYFIKKFGLENHVQYIQESRRNYLSHLVGQIHFVHQINPDDKWAVRTLESIDELSG